MMTQQKSAGNQNDEIAKKLVTLSIYLKGIKCIPFGRNCGHPFHCHSAKRCEDPL
jgi:hypothetical protein